jgi:hypothetical protein
MNRILVQFKGEGSGVEELSWGQRAQWGSITIENGVVRSAGGTMALEEGVELIFFSHLLAFLMSRHQSLRTKFQVDAAGEPTQVVYESGEHGFDVVDAADDEDPAEVAEAVRLKYESVNWDIYNEWPVRMAVILHHGKPSHFVALYAHNVIDGYGLDALVTDLANLDKQTGEHLAPVSGMTSSDQARMQRTPAGHKQGNVSLRYWEKHLRSIPLRQFKDPAQEQENRHWDVHFTSLAAYKAMTVIAARTGMHSGTILLGAYAGALAKVTGTSTVVMRMLVSNRYRPGFKDSVSAVSQAGLCVIDTADCTFEELMTRAWRAQLAAGRHSYYEPRDLWKIIDQVAEDRGAKPELQCYYNDRRRAMAEGPLDDGPPPTKQETLDALAQTSLRWGPHRDKEGATAYFLVNIVPDTFDCLLKADTTKVTPSQMEGCLRGIESILIDGAFGPER